MKDREGWPAADHCPSQEVSVSYQLMLLQYLGGTRLFLEFRIIRDFSFRKISSFYYTDFVINVCVVD